MTHVLLDERLFADDPWLRAPHVEALRDGLRLEIGGQVWVCESWLTDRERRLRGGMIAGLGSVDAPRPLGRAARAHLARQEELALEALRARLGAKLAPPPDMERLAALGEADPFVLDDTGAWGVACELASKGRRTLLVTDDPARYDEFAQRFAERSWPKPEVVGPLSAFMRHELKRLPELSDGFLLEAVEADALIRQAREALEREADKRALDGLLARNAGWFFSDAHVGEPELGFVDLDARADGGVVVATVFVTPIDVELVSEHAMVEAGGSFIGFEAPPARWALMEARVHMEFDFEQGELRTRRADGVSIDVPG